ncbi:hypothetical protein IFR05_002495 [Cadophora sp. M221]|nr:hypothetical protein IFR05_002495 [Cadophora sp. M221]
MIGMRSLAALAAAVSVAYAAAVPAPEDEWHLALLKRQEPGTPLYECHSACGTAITLSRGPSPCTDSAFLSDYADCLVCSGPDNFNIWRYYGGTLTTAGSACGLSTTPASGTPTGTTSSAAPTTSSTAQPTTESTAAPEPVTVSSSTAAPTPTGESTTTPASASESASVTAPPTESTTSATIESASTVSPTVAPTYTPHTTGSVTTTAGNSTSTTVPFTGGANSSKGKIAGALAIVAGAIFAAAL